jgi:NTP pyrophosphatase (non-canonical NTP hydrolase)
MKNKLKEIADYYKLDTQSRQLNEELAELIQANSKYSRYSENNSMNWEYLQNMCEEIADVQIMIEQMLYLLDIDNKAIEKIKMKKIDRQLERIKLEQEKEETWQKEECLQKQ